MRCITFIKGIEVVCLRDEKHLTGPHHNRLQSPIDHRYHVVSFNLVGTVREFPTAPKDSFLVANAAYVSEKTGSSAAQIVLLRTAGDPLRVADKVRPIVATLPGARVTDIVSTRRVVTSSLTAVDLHGLTALELVFAVLFVTAASGLVLALGLTERRRTFAVLTALGAQQRQLGAFVWSESLIVLIGGGIAGAALGTALAIMLVKVLTGVFDPPPETLAIPWGYLGLVVAAAVSADVATVYGTMMVAQTNRTKAFARSVALGRSAHSVARLSTLARRRRDTLGGHKPRGVTPDWKGRQPSQPCFSAPDISWPSRRGRPPPTRRPARC